MSGALTRAWLPTGTVTRSSATQWRAAGLRQSRDQLLLTHPRTVLTLAFTALGPTVLEICGAMATVA
jgi:hypothetical protein